MIIHLKIQNNDIPAKIPGCAKKLVVRSSFLVFMMNTSPLPNVFVLSGVFSICPLPSTSIGLVWSTSKSMTPESLPTDPVFFITKTFKRNITLVIQIYRIICRNYLEHYFAVIIFKHSHTLVSLFYNYKSKVFLVW